MTTPKVLLIHSKDQNMIVDPDPQSKRWCAKFPDHEPPAKPGVCSDDTDQTYAGSGKDSTSNSCEGRGMLVFLELFYTRTLLTRTQTIRKSCEESTSTKACVGKRTRMESVFVRTRLKVEVKEMVAVVVVEVVPEVRGGPGDYDVGEGKGIDRGTTRTGYEGKGFEFGKNQAGRDLGTTTSLTRETERTTLTFCHEYVIVRCTQSRTRLTTHNYRHHTRRIPRSISFDFPNPFE